MSYHLRYTNPYGEIFYLVNTGLPWPKNPLRRMIERTSRLISEARAFDTAELANETLVITGSPRGYEIVDEAGRVQ